MRKLLWIISSLLMAACSERNAPPRPADPASDQAAVIRAHPDSIIDRRDAADAARSRDREISCCGCEDVAKIEEEVLPDSCYFKFNLNEQGIFIASDTTDLIEEPDMKIKCINDAIVINGRTVYTFSDVFNFEELIALKKWNDYYIYGFISTTDDHGPMSISHPMVS